MSHLAVTRAGQKVWAKKNFSAQLSALIKEGKWKRAFQQFKEAKDNSPDLLDTNTYTVLITACGGNLDKAESLVKDMTSRDVSIDLPVYNSLLQTAGNTRRLEEVFRVWGIIKGSKHKPDLLSYHALLEAASKCASEESRQREIWPLVEKAINSGEIKPNGKTLNLAILQHEEQGDHIFECFDHFGVSRNTYTFNILLEYSIRKRDSKRFFELLGLMHKTGVQLDVVTYNSQMKLHLLEEVQKPHVVFDIHDQMQAAGVHPDLATWGMLLRACSSTDDFERAWDCFEKIRQGSLIPNARFCKMLYDFFVRAEHWERVRKVYDYMREKKIDIKTHMAIASVVLDTGQLSIVNGNGYDQLSLDTKDLVMEVRRAKMYDFNFSALTPEARKDIGDTVPKMKAALTYHCEKMALACLRHHPRPMIHLNMYMCDDCVTFFKAVSVYLNKQVTVKISTGAREVTQFFCEWRS